MSTRIKYKYEDIVGSYNIMYIDDVGTDHLGKRQSLFLCHCGKEFIKTNYYIRKDIIISCGCLKGLGNKKHGLKNHPLYSTWVGMRQRCYNPNSRNYLHYGWKGIKVCEEWMSSFKIFYDWAILNNWEKGMSIHRKEIDKDYNSNNCIILTKSEHIKLHNEVNYG